MAKKEIMELRNLPILMLSMSRWDQGFSSASISLAKELAKKNKVIYIDHPISISEFIRDFRTKKVKRRWKALFFGARRYSSIITEDENITVVVPFVTFPINSFPKGALYNFFYRINNGIYSLSIRRILKDFSIDKFIYWNSYNPFFVASFPKGIKPALIIYQSRDNIEESNYVKIHGPYLERAAAQKADIRLATSSQLAEKLSGKKNEFTFFPNAANVELFLNTKKNENNVTPELEGVTGKIIGYTGNICLRQDYDLLYKIATTFPDHVLLLVGPRNDTGYHEYNFEELGNVIFTGGKNLDELPKYLSKMDVAIIPFKVNKLTESIYPLKLNEYLAAGKPVVSTAFSKDLLAFSNVVSIATNYEDFLNKIAVVIREDNSSLVSKRIEVALKNSWSNRVEFFWQLAENVYYEKRRFK